VAAADCDGLRSSALFDDIDRPAQRGTSVFSGEPSVITLISLAIPDHGSPGNTDASHERPIRGRAELRCTMRDADPPPIGGTARLPETRPERPFRKAPAFAPGDDSGASGAGFVTVFRTVSVVAMTGSGWFSAVRRFFLRTAAPVPADFLSGITSCGAVQKLVLQRAGGVDQRLQLLFLARFKHLVAQSRRQEAACKAMQETMDEGSA